MKRSIITYFLLSVMALQLLPVKEMGQLLYNNQLTEEICDALETANEHNEHSDVKKITVDKFFSKLSAENSQNCFIIANSLHKEVVFISRIFDDTPTPPPLA